MKYKISFNKFSVILMYLCMIGLVPLCLIVGAYPETPFLVCWVAFWICQSLVTCRLQIDKRNKHDAEKHRTAFFEALTPYVNEENATALIEKYIGIEPKYNKKKEKKGE